MSTGPFYCGLCQAVADHSGTEDTAMRVRWRADGVPSHDPLLASGVTRAAA